MEIREVIEGARRRQIIACDRAPTPDEDFHSRHWASVAELQENFRAETEERPQDD